MKTFFNAEFAPDELHQYYRDRLFELVDFDATTSERKKIIGENRYEYIDKIVEDIEKNNKLYQKNGKTIGFVYGTFYTVIVVFIVNIIRLLFF